MAKRKVASRRLRRPLKPSERIVYRDRKGKVRKFRSDLNLIAEVWSVVIDRKTGRLKPRKTSFTINKVEAGRPVPQKFKPIYKAMQTVTRGPSVRKFLRDFNFPVHSSDWMVDQIPDDVVNGINRSIRNAPLFLKVHVEFDNGTSNTSPDVYLERPMRKKDLSDLIAVLIINAARAIQNRMSPKQFARNDKEGDWYQPSFADVTVTLSRNKRVRRATKKAKSKTKAKRKTKSMGTRHRGRRKRKR